MYIRRVHTQHGTKVISLPKPICHCLEIDGGDYLGFIVNLPKKTIIIEKISPGGIHYEEPAKHPDKPDRRRKK